jgi:hypothetical protein
MKRGIGDRHTARGFPPQIEGDRIHGLAVRQSVQRLQRDHRGHHIGRHAGPTPTAGKQVREQLVGEQLAAMRGQEPKHTARLEQMPRHRLRIKNFSLIIRATLHPKIIPNPTTNQPTATQDYSGLS